MNYIVAVASSSFSKLYKQLAHKNVGMLEQFLPSLSFTLICYVGWFLPPLNFTLGRPTNGMLHWIPSPHVTLGLLTAGMLRCNVDPFPSSS